ncbi:hypothetical protein Tco_0023670 [Tanacetum coccineum]
MKRGYAGNIIPLLPAMLVEIAVNQGEGSTQPAEPQHTPVDPISSTSQPHIPSPLQQSPTHPSLPFSPPYYSPPGFYEAPLHEGNTLGSAEDSSLVRESMKEKSTDFTTPTKASGEAQKEEISPTILEAAKTLRRARSMAKKIDTGLDDEEEINTDEEEINTGREEINTGREEIILAEKRLILAEKRLILVLKRLVLVVLKLILVLLVKGVKGKERLQWLK